MGKLNSFTFLSVNGCYKGVSEDIGWHKHSAGGEETEFGNEGAQSGTILLFGRTTYTMMERFWPTPAALQVNPVMADGMNKAEKIVFSKTLKAATWNNTRIVGDMIEEVKRLKRLPGKDMTVLGSGKVLTQLAQEGLVDEFQLMIDPVAIGGTPLFHNLTSNLELKLVNSRTFKSGVVLLNYKPEGK